MKSEKNKIKFLTIGTFIIVIVSSTLFLGFFLKSNTSNPASLINTLNPSYPTNSYLTINSIDVSNVSQSEYSSNAYFYSFNETPPPAKVIYALMFNMTIFLNKTYTSGVNSYGYGLGICTFDANFVNSTAWSFVPYMTSCPIANQYNEGNTSFIFFRQIIPSNYNANITYPIQIAFSVSSNTNFPVSLTSHPFILQVKN